MSNNIKVEESEDNHSTKAKHYVVSTLFNTSLFVMMSVITKVINLINKYYKNLKII